MYSLNSDVPNEPIQSEVDTMSTALPIQLIPVIVETAKMEFGFNEPVALYMGDGIYRIFDVSNPSKYVNVQFIQDEN